MKANLSESLNNENLDDSLSSFTLLLETESVNVQVCETTVDQAISNSNLSISFNGHTRFKIKHTVSGLFTYIGIKPETDDAQWIAQIGNAVKALPSNYQIINSQAFSATTVFKDFVFKYKGNIDSGSSFLGQTKYIGVKFKLPDGTHYGWIKIAVASDANSITVLSYAYHTTPDEGIKAGSTTALPRLS